MSDLDTGVYAAVPFDPSDPAKLSYLLDCVVEHDSYWTDFQADPLRRRTLVAGLFAEALRGETVHIHEVWLAGSPPQLVGMVGFMHIVPAVQATFHPIFFDGKLRNASGKRDLLLRCMDWAFRAYDLHRLAIELPENGFALVDFARSKLGFRFEGEGRTIRQRRVKEHGHLKRRQWLPVVPSAREAEWGSRRYQALFKNGQWLDLLLLSVTRDEFTAFVREATWAVSSTDQIPSKPSPAT